MADSDKSAPPPPTTAPDVESVRERLRTVLQGVAQRYPQERKRAVDAALGVIVGVGIALLFLVWAFPGFRDPAYQQDRYQYAKNSEAGEDNPVEASSLWDTYTSPKDTYAQWIAALSAIFSVGVSIWAVFLVRSTLELNRDATKAAQDAVAVTREIGNRQLRAYVTANQFFYNEYSVKGVKRGIAVGAIFVNNGQTPARKCVLGISPKAVKMSESIGVAINNAPASAKIHSGVAGPGAQISTGPVNLTFSTLQAIEDGTAQIFILARCEYVDAFEQPRWTDACAAVELRKLVADIKAGDTDGCVAFRITSEHNDAT